MLAAMVGRLTDVAEKVGVSEATVSRVLNGRPGVSEATRKAVLTALDVLGYERPTKLRGERARLVGLVLPELQNPIFPAFADVVGGSLAQQGLTPVLCTHTAGLSEADYVELLFEQHVSGVLFAGGQLQRPQRRPRPLPGPHRPQAADRAGQRRHRRAAVPPGVLRRRGGRRPGVPPPRVARAHPHRAHPRARPITCRRCGKLEAARRTLAARRARAGRRPGRVHPALARGRPGGRGAAAARGASPGSCAPATRWRSGAIRATKRAGLSVPARPVGRRATTTRRS